MQRLSGKKLIIVAAVAGLVAVLAGYYYLYLKEQQLLAQYRQNSDVMVTLVVPKLDMNKGDTLSRDKIAALEVPANFVPSNAVTADRWETAVGRTLSSGVQRGKPLTWDAITGDAVDRFSQTVAVGKRAKTISISKINSVDGLLRPGDRVDLYGKFSAKDIGSPVQEGMADDVVMLVLENVEVLAAGRQDASGRRYENFVDQGSADGFNMNFSTVTMHLTDYQAVKVELAQQTGELIAVLRNPKDVGSVSTRSMNVADMLRPEPRSDMSVVVDQSGKFRGRVVNDQILDANGKVIGRVVNGQAIGLDGRPMGDIVNGQLTGDTLVVKGGDSLGNLQNRTRAEQVVRDANGNVIGTVVDGKILDANGKVLGQVVNGVPVDLTGKTMGALGTREFNEQVVLDANGNVVGVVRDGLVRDGKGEIIGEVKNGDALTLGGWAVRGIQAPGEPPPPPANLVEFIAGGKGKDGVNAVQKITVDSGEKKK